MAIPPEDLFARQEREAAKYADARARKVLAMLETARREIQMEISDSDTFTARRVAELAQQIDRIIATLGQDIRAVGDSSKPLSEIVKRHLQESLGVITGSPYVVISVDALNIDSLILFSQNELAHVTTLVAAEKETIKSILFTKVGVKGENPTKVARALAGKDSQFAGRFGHVDNILRTETSTVYNKQSVLGIQYANEQYDLKLNKKIVETIDYARNNPISLVLNGQIQTIDKKFKAKVSEVHAAAARIKKHVGGIFWPIVDGYYTGMMLPAHYRERGIVVPTDEPVNAP